MDTRPDRMPPRAPALLRWAGTSTSSAGYWSNSVEPLLQGDAGQRAERGRREQHRQRLAHDPAQVLEPAAGRDHDDRDRRDRQHDAEAVGDQVDPDQAGGQPQRREGEHVAEHADDRGGDAVEVPVPGGPRPRSAPAWPPARRSTRARRRRSRSPRGRARRRCPRSRAPTATTFATTAMPTDRPAVSTAAASRFCPSTVSRRSDRRNVPAWIAVEMRLPKAPKMLPAQPDGGRHEHEQPGHAGEGGGDRARAPPPATRLVALFSPRAARLCRAFGPRVLRRRSTNRPMPEVWSDHPARRVTPRTRPAARSSGEDGPRDTVRSVSRLHRRVVDGPGGEREAYVRGGAGGPGRVSALVRATLRRASAVRSRKRAGGQPIGPNDGTVHIDDPRSSPGR